jgi:hypothetical protein
MRTYRTLSVFGLFISMANACGQANDLPMPGSMAGTGLNVSVGSIAGQPFFPVDAIFTDATAAGLELPGRSTIVIVTDYAQSCAKEQGNLGTPNGRGLSIGLGITDGSGGSGPATEGGTYQIYRYSETTPMPPPNAKVVQIFYQQNGADCRRDGLLEAAAGNVTIFQATADGVTGEYEFDFAETGEHVRGTFAAAPCPALNPNRTPLNGCN